jgi:hypothetical protein
VTGERYPWYGVIHGVTIEQGDILEAYPVFQPPPDLDEHAADLVTLQWSIGDVIILSQIARDLHTPRIDPTALSSRRRRGGGRR